MDEDSKGQRKMEDSGGGLLPAVEEHSLEWNRINILTCSVLHWWAAHLFNDHDFLFVT